LSYIHKNRGILSLGCPSELDILINTDVRAKTSKDIVETRRFHISVHLPGFIRRVVDVPLSSLLIDLQARRSILEPLLVLDFAFIRYNKESILRHCHQFILGTDLTPMGCDVLH
jgi:hypothetical protein